MSEIELFNTGKKANLPVNSDAIPPIPQKSDKKGSGTNKPAKRIKDDIDVEINIDPTDDIQRTSGKTTIGGAKALELAIRKEVIETMVNERSVTYAKMGEAADKLDEIMFGNLARLAQAKYGIDIDSDELMEDETY